VQLMQHQSSKGLGLESEEPQCLSTCEACAESGERAEWMNGEDVLAKVLEYRDLPTLPEVVSKILAEVESENSDVGRLTYFLESDPAISARILRVANSAFYGLEREVISVQRAVVVLGFITVRDLVLSTAVFDALSGKNQMALDFEDFWLHSLGTARAAHLLSRKYCPSALNEGCFTAGLLHDIGKYLLALVLRERYAAIVRQAETSKCRLRDLEAERLGTTHAEVGAKVAEEWKFPVLLTQVIGNLYEWKTYSGPCRSEVCVVALANEISRLVRFGNAGDWNAPSLEPTLLGSIGLTEELVDKVAEEVADQRSEILQFFRLLKS